MRRSDYPDLVPAAGLETVRPHRLRDNLRRVVLWLAPVLALGAVVLVVEHWWRNGTDAPIPWGLHVVVLALSTVVVLAILVLVLRQHGRPLEVDLVGRRVRVRDETVGFEAIAGITPHADAARRGAFGSGVRASAKEGAAIWVCLASGVRASRALSGPLGGRLRERDAWLLAELARVSGAPDSDLSRRLIHEAYGWPPPR
ncbi:hypothetical protein ACPYO6_15230 [Georgenia sp. Z1344]|uniref:hypothetical protein n=1 Tax=Georgenia sp. Z1344 TaxID=3416706 RepID=UPI003CF86BE6